MGLKIVLRLNDALCRVSMAIDPSRDWEDVHLPDDGYFATTSRPGVLKRVTGVQNCTSVVAVWDRGSFATHQHLAKLRGDSRLQFAKVLRADLARIKAVGGESMEVFIAGGSYYSDEYAMACGERLIVEVEERFRVGRISPEQRDQILRVINDGIRVIPYLSAQEGDRRENYREFVEFLRTEIADAVGQTDPVVFGPNGVPAAVHVVVANSPQPVITIVKPQQPNPAMNGCFRASKISDVTKTWDKVA